MAYVCAFCGQKAGGKLGGLKNTPDKSILAHHDCLIFSPQVFTNESGEESEFDIHSVLAEIRRGKTLKCSFCKKPGATIGCDIKQCQKTYHYECVEKDRGVRDESRYIIYCSKHANYSDAAEGIKRPRTPDSLSMSPENKMPGKKKRQSTTGIYTFQRTNKKTGTVQDTESSQSPERPSTSYESITLRKMNRRSEPGLPSNQNIKHTRKTGDNTEDQQTDINDASNGDNLKTASVSASKAWHSRLRNIKEQQKITRDEDPDGMESESPETSPISNKVGKCPPKNKKIQNAWSKQGSRDKDHNRMQRELSEPSLEDSRKEENSRDEDQNGIQCTCCTISSHDSENLITMEIESPESSVLSASASNKSVLILPEISYRANMQLQAEDGDVAFAMNLIQFLRKVPEDKKLPTQIAILNVLLSASGQQPISTSNPDCVP